MDAKGVCDSSALSARVSDSLHAVPRPLPKVIRANVLGYCMGVRRAVKLAYTEAEGCEKQVRTFGSLIHNPQVLRELEARGVRTLDESSLPNDLDGVSVVIRAHGISPQVEEKLRERKAVLVDATCPIVKASQLKARALAKAGYLLFLAGDKSHAELAGIVGYSQTMGALPCVVVGDANEAGTLAKTLAEKYRSETPKTALLAQTTISEGEYKAIEDAIVRFFPNLEVARTICAATKERQESLRKLLDRVDALVIVGGRESANTRRLYAIAEAVGKPCVLAEDANDIPVEFLDFGTIGITAGASTPDNVIGAIERVFQGGVS